MRIVIFFFFTLLFSLTSVAESFNQYNSIARTALVLYSQNAQGFYNKQTNLQVDDIRGIEAIYAYDKKNKQLYVATLYGNYVVTLTDDKAKMVKKDKAIPQPSEKDIEALVQSVSQSLDEKYARFNALRRQFISDSISNEKEKEKLIAIQRARDDSLKKAKEQELVDIYRSRHDWHWLPIKKESTSLYGSTSTSTVPMECSLCDKKISSYSTDSIYVVAINNDTIYSLENKDVVLGFSYFEIHAYKIPQELETSKYYLFHTTAFRDSLFSEPNFSNSLAQDLTYYSLKKCLDGINKEAPYGFFGDWGWDNEYASLSFHFEYTNLNKRTIKYIDVYWKVTNDVNDVRGTGHFKGTGPVEQNETGKWNWDYSSYYVGGDASTMNITKVIITYMNGQQQVLTGKNIIFD